MKNELQIFEEQEVEIVVVNEVVLFNPRDVGTCLELSKSAVRSAIGKMSDNQVIKLTNSNVQDLDFRKLHNTGENFLTESGVYKLIFKSQSDKAEEFQDWVTDIVLPQIRKTGGYIPIKEDDTDIVIMSKALKIMQNTLSVKDELLELQKPKVEAYNILMDSNGNLDFNSFVKSAKLIVGRNTFIDVLRNNKIIRQKPSTEPYETYRQRGYFKVIQTVNNGHSNTKTLITKKGTKWLLKKCIEWDLVESNLCEGGDVNVR